MANSRFLSDRKTTSIVFVSCFLLMMFSCFFPPFSSSSSSRCLDVPYINNLIGKCNSEFLLTSSFYVDVSLDRVLRRSLCHFLSLFVQFYACASMCSYETNTLYQYNLPALACSTFTSCARYFFLSSSSILLCWRMLVVLYSALSLPRQSSSY